MRHSVEVVASSLYEAAVLALKEFRSCSFTEVSAGKGTRLHVAVRPPADSHEITVGQVESWLKSREDRLGSRLRRSSSPNFLADDGF